ncbi:MAG TPA: hypothetical protein VGC15_12525 [Acetobacteraceae bacterium]
MIPVALGLLSLAVLLWAARGFAQARVANLKAMLGWLAALAGLAIGAGLLLTGRGVSALFAAVLLGPLALSWWQEGKLPTPGRPGAPPSRGGRMPRSEALAVLGLQDPVSDADVREAWVRLMRVAHPDSGGSDWLAARVNQARDTLLRR